MLSSIAVLSRNRGIGRAHSADKARVISIFAPYGFEVVILREYATAAQIALREMAEIFDALNLRHAAVENIEARLNVIARLHDELWAAYER